MATQPTRSIRWATDGGADIVEPSGGERDIGWIDGQKPPAEYFNYLMRGYYDWQQFFVTEMLQRDGSVPVTGDLVPDSTGANRKVGTTGARFDANLNDVNMNGNLSFTAPGGINSTIPVVADDAYDLGAAGAGNQLRRIYARGLTVSGVNSFAGNTVVGSGGGYLEAQGELRHPGVAQIGGRIDVNGTASQVLQLGPFACSVSVISATKIRVTPIGVGITTADTAILASVYDITNSAPRLCAIASRSSTTFDIDIASGDFTTDHMLVDFVALYDR